MGAQKDGDSGQAHGSAGDCQGLGAQNTCPGYPVRGEGVALDHHAVIEQGVDGGHQRQLGAAAGSAARGEDAAHLPRKGTRVSLVRGHVEQALDLPVGAAHTGRIAHDDPMSLLHLVKGHVLHPAHQALYPLGLDGAS